MSNSNQNKTRILQPRINHNNTYFTHPTNTIGGISTTSLKYMKRQHNNQIIAKNPESISPINQNKVFNNNNNNNNNNLKLLPVLKSTRPTISSTNITNYQNKLKKYTDLYNEYSTEIKNYETENFHNITDNYKNFLSYIKTKITDLTINNTSDINNMLTDFKNYIESSNTIIASSKNISSKLDILNTNFGKLKQNISEFYTILTQLKVSKTNTSNNAKQYYSILKETHGLQSEIDNDIEDILDMKEKINTIYSKINTIKNKYYSQFKTKLIDKFITYYNGQISIKTNISNEKNIAVLMEYKTKLTKATSILEKVTNQINNITKTLLNQTNLDNLSYFIITLKELLENSNKLLSDAIISLKSNYKLKIDSLKEDLSKNQITINNLIKQITILLNTLQNTVKYNNIKSKFNEIISELNKFTNTNFNNLKPNIKTSLNEISISKNKYTQFLKSIQNIIDKQLSENVNSENIILSKGIGNVNSNLKEQLRKISNESKSKFNSNKGQNKKLVGNKLSIKNEYLGKTVTYLNTNYQVTSITQNNKLILTRHGKSIKNPIPPKLVTVKHKPK